METGWYPYNPNEELNFNFFASSTKSINSNNNNPNNQLEIICEEVQNLENLEEKAENVENTAKEEEKEEKNDTSRENRWGNVRFVSCLQWMGDIDPHRKANCRHLRVKGCEVRLLPSSHLLHGQCGLFATEKFSKYDILGEYTGVVADGNVWGKYVAALGTLSIDASTCGNELRFINSYINIACCPNLVMKTTFINTYPHVILICLRDIEIGDEFLLDYGEAYNREYIYPKNISDFVDI